MHTLLGAGGAIGVELAKALSPYRHPVKLVSRNPKKVNEDDLLHPADLSDKAQVDKAVEGSEVCYLLVGFEYKLKVWREKWLPLIQNVTEACMHHGSKLVFFDNVYAIGGNDVNHILETSPMNPSSKKGAVRAEVDRHILDLVEKGKLDAIIARAPDFFGPIKDKSLLMFLIYDNLIKGKSAQWFCNADVPHSTGFAPDLAKGTAMLGNTPDAFNQIWNLPVDPEAPTGREWAAMFAEEMDRKAKVQTLPGWAMGMLGIFIPVMKELYEMRYQYDRKYDFDSSKFCGRFNYTPTSNREAVAATVAALGK